MYRWYMILLLGIEKDFRKPHHSKAKHSETGSDYRPDRSLGISSPWMDANYMDTIILL